MLNEKIIFRREDIWKSCLRDNLKLEGASEEFIDSTYDFIINGNLEKYLEVCVASDRLVGVSSVFSYTHACSLEALHKDINLYCQIYLASSYSLEHQYITEAPKELGRFFSNCFSLMRDCYLSSALLEQMADIICNAPKGTIEYDADFNTIGRIKIPVNSYEQALHLCGGLSRYLFSKRDSLLCNTFKKYVTCFFIRLNEIDDGVYSTTQFDRRYSCPDRGVKPRGIQNSLRAMLSNLYGYMTEYNVDDPDDFCVMDEELKNLLKDHFDKKATVNPAVGKLIDFIKKHDGKVIFQSE